MVKKLLPVLFLLILSFLFLLPFTYELAYLNKIYAGTTIGDIAVGNQTKKEARQLLEKKLDQQLPTTISLTQQEKEWIIPTQSLKIQFNLEPAVKKAYAVGRSGNFLQQAKEKWLAWRHEENIALSVSFSQNNLNAEVDKIYQDTYQAGQPFGLSLVNGAVKITPPQPGQAINKRKTKEAVIAKIKNRRQEKITLPTTTINQPPAQEEIDRTVRQAENLIGKKIVLKAGEQIYVWNDNALIALLHPYPVDFEENIKKQVSEIAKKVERPAENALFEFKNNRVSVFRQAQQGQKLAKEKTISQLAQVIEKLSQTENNQLELSLPLTTNQPQITTAQVNGLGIKEEIGRGTSFFRGSIAGRVHNIKTAAARFNGVLVSPSKTFSFNATLGEVTMETGYHSAYIIKDGRTQRGVGGGVCQVSTTLFRAALNTGLPILERQAHAYRVSYYEQESKLGFDATVYSPHPDLVIENNTSNHILIQTEFFPKEYKLVFKIFGTNDGRQIEISDYRTWGKAPPPPPLYIEDPALPAEEVKQIDWPAWGAKAEFHWKVTKNGAVLNEKDFYSNYRPWQAVYLKGTKAN